MNKFLWIKKSILFILCLLPSWGSYNSSRNDSPYWYIGILCSAILIGIVFPYKVWKKALLFTLLLPILYLFVPTSDGEELGRELLIYFFPLTLLFMYFATAIYIFPGAYVGVLVRLLLLGPAYNHFFQKDNL
jgi:hypothetical protein